MPPLYPNHRPKPLRVLVVDDDDVFAGSLSAILTGNPRLEVVDRAADGAEGVTLALRHRPDVIVMDVNMPIMDGFAATRLVRAKLPDVRIVIVSAAPEDGHMCAARRAGADVYLLKDCGFDVLEEALDSEPAAVERMRMAAVTA